jgi:serine/threonine protein kinase
VAKVVDFGLVKQLKTGEDASVTAFGVLTGTPLYMAPESIAGKDDVGPRADLYSLAAVGYFLLVGQPVFPGRTVVEVCAQHLHVAPTPIRDRRREITEALDSVILRCLEKAPENRFENAAALREALLSSRGAQNWTETDASTWWARHREPFRLHCQQRRTARANSGTELPLGRAAKIAVNLENRGSRESN